MERCKFVILQHLLLDKKKEVLKSLTSEELLKDRSSKLNKAVEKGEIKGAGVAQMMMATATSKIEKLRREVDKVRESKNRGKGEKKTS